MLDLTPCNYCTLQDMKRRAKQKGDRLEARKEPTETWPEAVAVYRNGTHVATFMALTDHCVC